MPPPRNCDFVVTSYGEIRLSQEVQDAMAGASWKKWYRLLDDIVAIAEVEWRSGGQLEEI
jgi:hypothetical protein